MDRQITIQPFTAEDQQEAWTLILAGLGEHFGWIDKRRNTDLDDIAASYASPDHIFLVATRAGELIGTGALRRTDKHTGEIVRVSVRRDLRGRGVGRMLITRLLAHAREAGLQRVVVETNNDWYDAIGLYQSCGFTQYAADDESVYLALNLDG